MTARCLQRGLAIAAAAGIGAIAILASCSSDPTKGYVFGNAYDSAISTVSVGVFQNPTYYHGVEIELTDAVIKQIQAATPWRVTSAGDAQTALTGKITDIRLQRLTTSGHTGYAEELDYEITVEFTWKDNRSGKTLASRRNFQASDTFAPALPAQERIEAGQHGAVQKLARDLVSELRSNW